MQYKVLNMADIAPCPQLFASLESLAEVVSLPPDGSTLRQCIHDYDAYFASLHVRADRSVLERAEKLRVIATPSTGLDHIDVAFAQSRDITILSLKDDIQFLEQITATAEMTWALLLATVRRLPWAFHAACAGRWARDEFRGRQLSGKTLGILGYGRLGRMVAQYGRSFRMRVIACDRNDSAPPEVESVDFPTLLRESDVLSIHIHLTPENHGLINRAALSIMKPGAILINTSRGAIIDETALLEALEDNRLAGAGLDVIDGEWSNNLKEHPLIHYAREHQNLIISPHIGGVTHESQSMALEYSVLKLKSYLEYLNTGLTICP